MTSGATGAAFAASKEKIERRTNEALSEFREDIGGANEVLARAKGILVFPLIRKGGIGIGGEYGQGALRIGGNTVDYYSTAAASIGLQFGGPYLGLFAVRDPKHVRQMPGRLCGETVDAEGKRGFVLTLSTREQHIRREKATSNICTNSGLCALAFSVHMTLLGEKGLRELAAENHRLACLAADRLEQVPGLKLLNNAFFNEFTLMLEGKPARAIVRDLADRGLMFVDDGTSAQSLTDRFARTLGIPFAAADMVLDATQERGYILSRLDDLERSARRNGPAIGVASAFGVSVEAIASWANEAKARGIEIVSASAAADDPER